MTTLAINLAVVARIADRALVPLNLWALGTTAWVVSIVGSDLRAAPSGGTVCELSSFPQRCW